MPTRLQEGAAIDNNFVKLFKLAQLCIEYLMDVLSESLAAVEQQLAEARQALEEERKFRLCDHEAIRQLQHENRKRRRLIQNLQLEMLRSPHAAPSSGTVSSTPPMPSALSRRCRAKVQSENLYCEWKRRFAAFQELSADKRFCLLRPNT
ncbi:hypothetical protein HPB48_017106 [Haemaphysalis longicornis]|uniref:Cilium assembly protein DZIP1 N-terminal domain-containing protein n=1 Tax=Haemaphysalis longicornis TaxID=44386 RepID=A0A9J6GSN6_HAELO|nr:hypothetical protein HPB48_017106 [Haemaphysalis longicornis]